MGKNLNIIFWGTPKFSTKVLDALLSKGYNISGVVTSPDKPAGRKKIIAPPPVKEFAVKHNIKVLQPVKLDDYYTREIENLSPDLFIVYAYGKIIPGEILHIPKFGALNIHPSLLPRWRGPSPIQYTILAGDKYTGVTIIKMDEQMDHGPIVTQKKIEVKSRFYYKDLREMLTKMAVDMLIEIIPKYINGKITLIEQDHSKATYSKIIRRSDGRIDWNRSALEVERMIKAFNPWPSAWTFVPMRDKRLRLKIKRGSAIYYEDRGLAPGYIWHNNKCPLLVKCSDGAICVERLVLEGKKEVEAAEFIRGYNIILGKRAGENDNRLKS